VDYVMHVHENYRKRGREEGEKDIDLQENKNKRNPCSLIRKEYER